MSAERAERIRGAVAKVDADMPRDIVDVGTGDQAWLDIFVRHRRPLTDLERLEFWNDWQRFIGPREDALLDRAEAGTAAPRWTWRMETPTEVDGDAAWVELHFARSMS